MAPWWTTSSCALVESRQDTCGQLIWFTESWIVKNHFPYMHVHAWNFTVYAVHNATTLKWYLYDICMIFFMIWYIICMYLTLDIGVWGPNVSRLLGGCFTLTFAWRCTGALEGWRPDRTAARTWRWDGDAVGGCLACPFSWTPFWGTTWNFFLSRFPGIDS